MNRRCCLSATACTSEVDQCWFVNFINIQKHFHFRLVDFQTRRRFWSTFVKSKPAGEQALVFRAESQAYICRVQRSPGAACGPSWFPPGRIWWQRTGRWSRRSCCQCHRPAEGEEGLRLLLKNMETFVNIGTVLTLKWIQDFSLSIIQYFNGKM